jgi:hypothetical protein
VSDPRATFGDAWNENGSNVGMTYRDNAYVSTTAAESVANQFNNYGAGVKMNILVPRGKRALGIEQSASSRLSHEKELLLDRGQTFRIVGDRNENGSRVLDVEVT